MPIILYRLIVLGITAIAVAAPLSLVIYQSFLTAPFFDPSAKLGLLAYSFVFQDPDFWQAFWTTITIGAGMVVIAVPLGALLAFLMVRTDVPGRKWLEPLILVPIFVSAVVIAFGYVVAVGPVGIFSTMAPQTQVAFGTASTQPLFALCHWMNLKTRVMANTPSSSTQPITNRLASAFAPRRNE